MLITKANGEREPFRPSKLETSLRTAGAEEKTIKKIIAHIEGELREGMTTTEIYHHAHQLLKQYSKHPAAARYSLKRAVMDLGPTGFPFEQFLAEIFGVKEFRSRTNIVIQGKCARHEIDFMAERSDTLIVGEAKFHNTPGFKTDLKTALYIDARFRDIKENQFGGFCQDGQVCQSWLVTNTKFTTNALSYARCRKEVTLVGWDYPEKHNLQQMIENTGVHPLTALSTLSENEKKRLFEAGHVLCRSVRDNEALLRQVGVTGKKAKAVLEEVTSLCIPAS